MKKKAFYSLLVGFGMMVAVMSCDQNSVETYDDLIPADEVAFDLSSVKFTEREQKALNLTSTSIENGRVASTSPAPLKFIFLPVSANETWSNDTIYVLLTKIYVQNNATLTIEPGTVVKGILGDGAANSSALIVTRGSKIEANGTEQAPVIFTAAADPIQPGHIYPDPADALPPGERGLWGGVILLGNSIVNSNVEAAAAGLLPGEAFIEGLLPNDTRNIFGGNNATDNSGTLTYVSIRYGGTEIGDGNEINGLTFGGVGSGTTVDFVEVISNRDDAFEWFGGTVNTKHLVGAFCGDDVFDWDNGFEGHGQFWFGYIDLVGDRTGEHDGGLGQDECASPFAIPSITNVTYRGLGNGSQVMQLRDNSGGKYYRGIFTDFGDGIEIESRGDLIPLTCADSGSLDRLKDGDILFKDNLFFNVANGTQAQAITLFRDRTDAVTNGSFSSVSGNLVGSTTSGLNDPLFNTNLVPSSGITQNFIALKTAFPELAGKTFFDDTNYLGAFVPGQGDQWTISWTMWARVFGNPGANVGPGTGTESPDPNP